METQVLLSSLNHSLISWSCECIYTPGHSKSPISCTTNANQFLYLSHNASTYYIRLHLVASIYGCKKTKDTPKCAFDFQPRHLNVQSVCAAEIINRMPRLKTTERAPGFATSLVPPPAQPLQGEHLAQLLLLWHYPTSYRLPGSTY